MKRFLASITITLISIIILSCDSGDINNSTGDANGSTNSDVVSEPKTCSKNISLSHDLSTIFDGDPDCTLCMGQSGDDFNILFSSYLVEVKNNTCPGDSNGYGGGDSNVKRVGNKLIIDYLGVYGFTIVLDITGDSISTISLDLDNSYCENTLTDFTGGLDYENKSLDYSYKLTTTEIRNCSSF